MNRAISQGHETQSWSGLWQGASEGEKDVCSIWGAGEWRRSWVAAGEARDCHHSYSRRALVKVDVEKAEVHLGAVSSSREIRLTSVSLECPEDFIRPVLFRLLRQYFTFLCLSFGVYPFRDACSALLRCCLPDLTKMRDPSHCGERAPRMWIQITQKSQTRI